jgi:predicted TIM-barrel fold metal-dependent hydrolase
MPRIDLHAHVITPRYGRTLRAGRRPSQTVELLERFMDRHQIDAAVVSMGGALQVETAEAARTGNEELAELIRAQPSRFGALAIVPFTAGDPDVATAEAAYALDTLGLDGVALFSNHAGSYLGDPEWEGMFSELDRRGAYAFVHPAAAPTGPVLPAYPPWLFEYPFDTTRALTNLIYSGTLDRHRHVRLQFAHLGGTAMFLAHRLASLAAREPAKAAGVPCGALRQLARQYYDTGLSNNMVALASTLRVTTLEHVVFGSDWPYLAEPERLDPTEDLDRLDRLDRERIDGHNAVALVPRLVRALGP